MNYLKEEDILLNLKEITISNLDSFSSSSCSGTVHFYIKCETKHGYCEDPDFTGKIKVLSIKKSPKKKVYLLKVLFEREPN